MATGADASRPSPLPKKRESDQGRLAAPPRQKSRWCGHRFSAASRFSSALAATAVPLTVPTRKELEDRRLGLRNNYSIPHGFSHLEKSRPSAPPLCCENGCRLG